MGHTIATIFLPRCYCQTYSGYPRVMFCLSTGGCTGASSTRHHRFPGAEGVRLRSSNAVAAEFTSSELSRLWHLEYTAGENYRSTIANVSELDTRLSNERDALSSQSWMVLSTSGTVVS